MRKGTKRKAKQQEAKQDAAEQNKNKAQPQAKRAKTSRPQSEPEYFEDKRNLVSEQLLHLHRCFNTFIWIRTVSLTEHSQEWNETNRFVCWVETTYSVFCFSCVFVSVLVSYAYCLASKWLC